MNEIFDLPTIMILVAAVFVLLKLRSVLGQRTGYQAPPLDPAERDRIRKQQEEAAASEPADNVIPMNPKAGVKNVKAEVNPAIKAINEYAKSGTKLNKGMKSIVEKTPDFTPEAFLNGAKMAYEMIVTGFADGDTKTLKNLLSKDVYSGFASAIKERKANGEKTISTFVGIETSKIKAAEIVEDEAHVTVQFISQIISATYDKEETIIDGDPEAVVEVNDIWTFARSTRSKDPNWKLIATESDS